MNINQIKYFVSVVEQQSFSLAAQSQCVTVQAVSKAIGDLERDFGEKLFLRSNHGAEPTELGMDFYMRARPVLEAFEGLEAFARGEARPAAEPMEFRIALASPDFMNNVGLCNAVSAFISQNTGFNAKIETVSPDIARQGLEKRMYCALMTIGKYEDDQVNCTPIGTLPTGVCLAQSHPLADRASVSLADLAAYPAGMSPICDTFNESILNLYSKRGLISNIHEVKTLSENDPSFMMEENGYFFSAIFPLPSQQTGPFSIVPINADEQIGVPICSITLKKGQLKQYHIIESFLIKAISGAARKA